MVNTPEQEAALARIATIDSWFEEASGWGSWMVAMANERERLVDQLNYDGFNLTHKYLARTASGGRVS